MDVKIYDITYNYMLKQIDEMSIGDGEIIEQLDSIFNQKLEINNMLLNHVYIGIYNEEKKIDKYIRIFIGNIKDFCIDIDIIIKIFDELKIKYYIVIYNKNEINKMDRLIYERFQELHMSHVSKIIKLYICSENSVQICSNVMPIDKIKYR